ncbi:unnamed protein product [Amoebophrya sp. A25]|nr:unnamed protein product [Amoebophrya sp. A25]|eukprot:GSA25T00000972001.1
MWVGKELAVRHFLNGVFLAAFVAQGLVTPTAVEWLKNLASCEEDALGTWHRGFGFEQDLAERMEKMFRRIRKEMKYACRRSNYIKDKHKNHIITGGAQVHSQSSGSEMNKCAGGRVVVEEEHHGGLQKICLQNNENCVKVKNDESRRRRK